MTCFLCSSLDFSRDSVFLLQLHFLCCDLHFCVGDVLHVATPICYVATTLFYMQHIFLSQPSFSGRDIMFFPPACLRVTTHIFCRNRNFLCSANFYVTVQFVMSRHDFFAFVLKPMSRLKSCVVTSFLSIQLIPVSLPEDLCCDIKTPFKLEVCCNIDSPCCNQISSSIKHPLSRPSFLVAP